MRWKLTFKGTETDRWELGSARGWLNEETNPIIGSFLRSRSMSTCHQFPARDEQILEASKTQLQKTKREPNEG